MKNNEQIDSLNNQSWSLKYSNTKKALELSKEAWQLSHQNSYPKGIAYSQLNSAVCNFLLSNDENILENLKEALKYFESTDDKLGQTRALNFLGNVYDNYGQYENGLNKTLKGLQIASQINYKEGEADLLSTTGLIYSRLSDYGNALNAFTQSLKIREESGDFKAASSSLNLIARTFSLKGDYSKALEFYNKSLNNRIEHNDTGGLPWNYIGMASLFEKMQNDEAAISHYQKSMEIIGKDGDVRVKMHCLLGLGKIESRKKNLKVALAYLNEALQIAVSLKSKPLQYDIHFALAEAYESDNDLSQSLHHFKAFHRLKEEVLNAETGNKLKQQQIGFAVERSEKEAEIFRLRNVELKAAFRQIEEKNKEITDSIHYAGGIQSAMLPADEDFERLLPDSFVLFIPKDIVSGDFYWVAEHNGKVIVTAADCTGHGVPGACMSMIGNSLLNQIVNEKNIIEPAKILDALNKGINHALNQTRTDSESRDGMDLAVCSIDFKNMELQYSGAFRPLYFFRKGQLTETKANKFAVGGSEYDGPKIFTNHVFQLQKGDTIYLSSDGYADQFNVSGTKLMTRKFKELLLEIQAKPMKEQKEHLKTFVQNWKTNLEQTDDILVIGLKI